MTTPLLPPDASLLLASLLGSLIAVLREFRLVRGWTKLVLALIAAGIAVGLVGWGHGWDTREEWLSGLAEALRLALIAAGVGGTLEKIRRSLGVPEQEQEEVEKDGPRAGA